MKSYFFRRYTQSELHYFVSLSEMRYGKTTRTMERIRKTIDELKFPTGSRRQRIHLALQMVVGRASWLGRHHYLNQDLSIKTFLARIKREGVI